MNELILDFFAGGGGASVGIEMALGRQVDIAVNHDPNAISIHRTNHPDTLHLTEDIFKVDLEKYVKGHHVGLVWASPDCTSHSKAKGDKPRKNNLRILPWSVYKHAKKISPDVIIMENVEEIQQWGPLDKNGKPIQEKKGVDYKKFIVAMSSLGYQYETRELIAADYGAPTTRKRWYAIFRRDGKEIRWPVPTHNKYGTNGLKKWEPIWKYLDLNDYGKSIFNRKKPLAEKTMCRIAKGIEKFVFQEPQPFMIQVNHGGGFRGQKLTMPMPTITQKHGFGIITPTIVEINNPEDINVLYEYSDEYQQLEMNFTDICGTHMEENAEFQFLTKFYKSGIGQSMVEPIHTITTSPGHFGIVTVCTKKLEKLFSDIFKSNMGKDLYIDKFQKCTCVSQFLMEYYGNGIGQSVKMPLHTIVTKDRFALITIFGTEKKYVITDIYLRMLTAEELKLGQGFPKDYILNRIKNEDGTWSKYSGAKQVARIGNSVVPIMAQKLVEANCAYLKVGDRIPNMELDYTENQIRFA